VAILDADKEGSCGSAWSLIQMIGRRLATSVVKS